MQYDTQKTTDSVREASTASQGDRELDKLMNIAWEPTQPRYTVELTTEGWQIKDAYRKIYLAGAFGTKRYAQIDADGRNKAGATEGEGRR